MQLLSVIKHLKRIFDENLNFKYRKEEKMISNFTRIKER